MSTSYHFDQPLIIMSEEETISFSNKDEDNSVLVSTTDKYNYFIGTILNKSQSLQIIKHFIQQFGFTGEELKDGTN